MTEVSTGAGFRRIILIVAVLNLCYFGVEFLVAFQIGSVSLLADSVDFLEDASLNLLIALAVGWSLAWRARLGMVLSGVLIIPALAALWMAWQKLAAQVPPGPVALSLTGAGAFAVNLVCAILLVRYRDHAGSLSKAAWLSARNDVLANVSIVLAGFLTAWTRSIWPDLLVGLGIAAINADAARIVWLAARAERIQSEPRA